MTAFESRELVLPIHCCHSMSIQSGQSRINQSLKERWSAIRYRMDRSHVPHASLISVSLAVPSSKTSLNGYRHNRLHPSNFLIRRDRICNL